MTTSINSSKNIENGPDKDMVKNIGSEKESPLPSINSLSSISRILIPSFDESDLIETTNSSCMKMTTDCNESDYIPNSEVLFLFDEDGRKPLSSSYEVSSPINCRFASEKGIHNRKLKTSPVPEGGLTKDELISQWQNQTVEEIQKAYITGIKLPNPRSKDVTKLSRPLPELPNSIENIPLIIMYKKLKLPSSSIKRKIGRSKVKKPGNGGISRNKLINTQRESFPSSTNIKYKNSPSSPKFSN